MAVTAGASAPEVLVQDVVEYLQAMGYGSVDEVEVMPENVRFGLPAGDCSGDRLRSASRAVSENNVDRSSLASQ